MKKLLIATLLGLAAAGAQVQAKTLLVYYSFTGNIEKAADAVKDQTPTDVLRIQPAQKGLNYAANNYSLGSDLVDQIRSKPNDAFSYPAIDPVNVDFSKYDTVIIGTPLWWSNMAVPEYEGGRIIVPAKEAFTNREDGVYKVDIPCLLYTSPSPRD